MAGATLYIEVDREAVTASIQRALQALDDDGTAELLEDIGEFLLASIRRRAAAQVSPDGAPWTPLTPRYAKLKATKRPGVPLLKFDNHMLGDGLSHQIDGNALLVGTSVVYGATHQFGRDQIPARPWLGLDDDDVTAVQRLMRRHLAAAFGTAAGD